MYFHLNQQCPIKKFWINDLNQELYHFWVSCKFYLPKMIDTIERLKFNYPDGRSLFRHLIVKDTSGLSSAERGARFFILNRITFSGTVESGGFSQSAFKDRFTDSSIQRLYGLDSILKDTLITNEDYSEVLTKPGHNVFIYCDPPYLSAKNLRLYGKNGDLHTTFNHEKFAQDMRSCQHKWMITYDDCEEV